MNPRLYILYLIIFCTFSIYAQKKPKVYEFDSSQINRKSLKINYFRSIADEVPVYYEFENKNNSTNELKFGIIYSNPILKFLYEGHYSSPRFYFYGAFLGFGQKKYFKDDLENYISYGLTYKFKFYNHQDFWLGGWGGSDYANDINLSQRLSVLNFQLLRGKNVINDKRVSDYYIGLGVNVTHAQTTYHYSKYPPVNEPYYDNGYFIVPTIHFGYKFGLKL